VSSLHKVFFFKRVVLKIACFKLLCTAIAICKILIHLKFDPGKNIET